MHPSEFFLERINYDEREREREREREWRGLLGWAYLDELHD